MARHVSAVIIDANIVVKWFIEDELSDIARTISAEQQLIAPWLILSETANALWKYVRSGQMATQDASDAVASLPESIEIIADPDLGVHALQLAVRLDHAAYDCFYLALAQRKALPLLTADARLIRLSAQIGVQTLKLESGPAGSE